MAGPGTQRLRHLRQKIAACEFCGLKSLDTGEAILLSLVQQYTLQWSMRAAFPDVFVLPKKILFKGNSCKTQVHI